MIWARALSIARVRNRAALSPPYHGGNLNSENGYFCDFAFSCKKCLMNVIKLH